MPERVAFRLSGWDTPLWANANRSAHRFNRAGQDATQYLALHPLGPWAEYLRSEDRRTPERLLTLRGRLWAVRIPADRDELAITFDTAASLGVQPDELIGDDHEPCRVLSDRLRADPAVPRLLRVPSAALPGADNLVVFGPRVAVPWDAEPVDDSELAASVIGEDARPPLALLELVRFAGDPHAGLEAWRAGQPLQPIEVIAERGH